MASTIQIIHARSKFRIGIDGDKSNSDFAVLESSAISRLNRIIGTRAFSADEKTEMTALIVLDMLQNEHGKGTIISETITEDSWKSKVNSSSQWMDELYTKIAEYDAPVPTTFSKWEGVTRSDSSVTVIVSKLYE
jgi:hypothetical protein